MELYLDVNCREDGKRLVLKKGVPTEVKVYIIEDGRPYDFSKVRDIEFKLKAENGNHVFRKIPLPINSTFLLVQFTKNDLSSVGLNKGEFILRNDYDSITSQTFILDVKDSRNEVLGHKDLECLELAQDWFDNPHKHLLCKDGRGRFINDSTVKTENDIVKLREEINELYRKVDTYKKQTSYILNGLNVESNSEDTFNQFKSNTYNAQAKDLNVYFQKTAPSECNGLWFYNENEIPIDTKNIEVVYTDKLPTSLPVETLYPSSCEDDEITPLVYNENNSTIWTGLVNHIVEKNGTKYLERCDFLNKFGGEERNTMERDNLDFLSSEFYFYYETGSDGHGHYTDLYSLVSFNSIWIDKHLHSGRYQYDDYRLEFIPVNTYVGDFSYFRIKPFNYSKTQAFPTGKDLYIRSISSNKHICIYKQEIGNTIQRFLDEKNEVVYEYDKTTTLNCFVFSTYGKVTTLTQNEIDFNKSIVLSEAIRKYVPSNITSLSIKSMTETNGNIYLIFEVSGNYIMLKINVDLETVTKMDIPSFVLQNYFLEYNNYVTQRGTWFVSYYKNIYEFYPETGEFNLLKILPNNAKVVCYEEFLHQVLDITVLRLFLSDNYYIDVNITQMDSQNPVLYIEYRENEDKYWTELVSPSVKTTGLNGSHTDCFKTGFQKAMLVFQGKYAFPPIGSSTSYYYGDGEMWNALENN